MEGSRFLTLRINYLEETKWKTESPSVKQSRKTMLLPFGSSFMPITSGTFSPTPMTTNLNTFSAPGIMTA